MQTVVSRLKELRRRRGLTAQQLADGMSDAGIPWEYGVVAKLETGRRKALSVAEWLALARVLDVPPVALLLPEEDTEYQVTPGSAPLSAHAVGEWLISPKPLSAEPNPNNLAEHPGENFTRQHRYFADWPAYLRRPPTVPEVEARAEDLNKQLAERQEELQRLLVEVNDQRHRLALAETELTRRRERRWAVETDLITLMERRRTSEVELREAHHTLEASRVRLEAARHDAKKLEGSDDMGRRQAMVELRRVTEAHVREAEVRVRHLEARHRELLAEMDKLNLAMKALEEGGADGSR